MTLENPAWTREELANAELVYPSGKERIPVSMRLDAETGEFFESSLP